MLNQAGSWSQDPKASKTPKVPKILEPVSLDDSHQTEDKLYRDKPKAVKVVTRPPDVTKPTVSVQEKDSFSDFF